MPEYDYPPSSQMQKRGPFEKDGHFFVKGYCHFEGKRYKCEFEVGYTQKHDIVLVAYLGQNAVREILGTEFRNSGGFPFLPNSYTFKDFAVEVAFSGQDIKSGGFVKVRRALWLVDPLAMFHRSPEFIADDFECHFPQTIVEQVIPKGAYSITLENAPPQTVFGENRMQSIVLFDAHQIFISTSRSGETLFSVPAKLIPIGISVAAIADLICAVLSLVTAKDVRWTKFSKFVADKYIVRYQRRSDIAFERSANRLIFESTSDPYSSQATKTLLSVSIILIRSRRISSKLVTTLSKYINLYIRYQVISRRAEDQGRLICTATEAFLENVESFIGKESGSISDMQARALWTNLRPRLREALTAIPDPPSGRKREKIEDRIKSFINKDLTRARLKDRLLYCAKQGRASEDWINTHFKPRLEGFETTRNHIAHLGIFPEMGDDSVQWTIHYYQMLMIMPLLFFALVGYDGEYIDLEQLQRDHLTRTP